MSPQGMFERRVELTSKFRTGGRTVTITQNFPETLLITVQQLDLESVAKIFARQEGHFLDFKGKAIAPGKLTRTVSAFANADGGEIFVGVEEPAGGGKKAWNGFDSIEAANGVLQSLENAVPLLEGIRTEFLQVENLHGFVLRIDVWKSRSIVKSAAGEIYIRRGAQNLPVSTAEGIARLELNKGLSSYESKTVTAPAEMITESEITLEFMTNVVPHQTAEGWLKKQMLLIGGQPTVAGAILFAEEPQAILPKHCGVKIYRYRTADEEGNREALEGIPQTVEGAAYRQIYSAVATTKQLVERIKRMTTQGLAEVEYPEETLHEIITNAILHRDYSIPDDTHIRIYDNRIEVESPGTLPGHITPLNILDERFSRNGNIVRIINKFPDPPNKDVGEGLNTAFRAMKLLQLKEPEIIAKQSSVLVVIRHEKLASPEERIMGYLETHETISNGQAREICVIREDWRVRNVFSRMVEAGMIEKVPGSVTSNTGYRKKIV